MLICKFCSKECKNSNSLKNHELRCKQNPNRLDPASHATGNRKGTIPWNKGLKRDPRCAISETNKQNLRNIVKSRSKEWHKENGKKISKTISEKVANGNWHTSLAKHMHINYNGNDLHGSWELAYVKHLDSNNIKWIRNKDSFSYVYKEKERKYTPDFYLPESDEYVEIKGYKTEKDSAKWAQFPVHRKLVVLTGKELKELKII